MKKYVSSQILKEYVDLICEKYDLTDNFKSAIMSQINHLKEVYSDQIPRDDFLELFGKQQAALRTGYRKPPVSIEEFLLSREYLNVSNTIRPKIKEELISLFTENDNCYEVLLSGALRIGKTYFACCALSYHLYKLSCLYNPQTHYKLAPGSEMVFIMQSLKEDKARRNFHEFKGLIDSSEYFKKHFPPQGKTKNFAIFPHNIKVKPVPATNTAAISENVFSAFIDEANFMKVIKGSIYQGEDDQYYDQATKLYQTIKDRIQYQFKDFSTGEWPGKLYLASSANHHGDFIQMRKEEAKRNNSIYVIDYPLWKVKDTDNYSGEMFWVKPPNEAHAGQIYYTKPNPMSDDIIEVPIELKEPFETNLSSAIREVAGVPISKDSKFIPVSTLIDNFKKYSDNYGGQQIFNTQEVDINDVIDLKSILNIPFIEAINNFFTFHAHGDMSVSQDCSGIAISAAVGSKVVEAKNVFSAEQDKYVQEDEITAPVYAVFGLLKIVPPREGQITREKVWQLFFVLKEYLTNLNSWTADFAYSTTISQMLRKVGIATDRLSVDKKSEPYMEMKNALAESRLWLPEHLTLKEEVKELRQDLSTGKIDHPPYLSKDVADAVAGSVFKLSLRKATHKKKGNPLTLQEMLAMIRTDGIKSERSKKTARPRSGNRPSGWQKGRGRRLV